MKKSLKLALKALILLINIIVVSACLSAILYHLREFFFTTSTDVSIMSAISAGIAVGVEIMTAHFSFLIFKKLDKNNA